MPSLSAIEVLSIVLMTSVAAGVGIGVVAGPDSTATTSAGESGTGWSTHVMHGMPVSSSAAAGLVRPTDGVTNAGAAVAADSGKAEERAKSVPSAAAKSGGYAAARVGMQRGR